MESTMGWLWRLSKDLIDDIVLPDALSGQRRTVGERRWNMAWSYYHNCMQQNECTISQFHIALMSRGCSD